VGLRHRCLLVIVLAVCLSPASPASAAADPGVDFSVPSETFSAPLSVALSTAVPGAQIRYTTDGRLPTAASPAYTGPIAVTATTRLRAQAFVDDVATGPSRTEFYLAADVATPHDLPVLVLDTFGAGRMTKADYQDAAVFVYQPKAGATVKLADRPALVSRGGVRLHGNSSATFPKRSMRLELHDENDKDANLPFLGMPADADWVLKGPYADKSLVRDALAYSTGAALGRLRAPRTVPVEVYLDPDGGAVTEADYLGVYLVTEKVEVSADRVNIAKLKTTDIAEPAVTGGYVLKFDRDVAEEPTIPCTGAAATCFRSLEVVEPGTLAAEQKEWLTAYLKKTNDALHAPDFADPAVGYAAYLDVDSFVDYMIINELSRNCDGYVRSSFLTKDRGGKLTAGPLWDYDLAWGNGGVRDNLAVEGWQYPLNSAGSRPANDWLIRLNQDPAFVARVAARWQHLRATDLSDAAIDARIDANAAPLTAAARRNFTTYPILDQARLVNWVRTPATETWQEQLDYLKSWIHQRAAWMDTQLG
jgi:CotH kinase protein/Chitobiase/beta-hexosaminidase C-terminal domain